MDITSPGVNLNRMMDSLGFPDKLGDLYGAALDSAIADNAAVTKHLFDTFSPLSTSKITRLLSEGISQAGMVPRPDKEFAHHFAVHASTYYSGEQIVRGKLNGPDGAAIEKEIQRNPAVRAAYEAKLGGRILFDGKADGHITVARPLPHPCVPFHLRLTQFAGSMLARVQDAARPAQILQGLAAFLEHTAPDIKLPPGFPTLSRLKVEDLGIPLSGRSPADTERLIKNDAAFRAGVESKIGGRILPDGFMDGRVTVAKFAPPPLSPASHAGARPTAPSATNFEDPSSILHDPSLKFEAKVAFFMFAFLEKKQKEIEAKMEALAHQKKHHGKGGKHGKGGGKKSGGKAKATKSFFQYGASLFGGMIGGPLGSTMGSILSGRGGNVQDGLQIPGAEEKKKLEQLKKTGAEEKKRLEQLKKDELSGSSDSGGSSDSIEMQKLQQMMEEMNKIFTLVDNMLKSMNDVVKQGPLASIRG